LVGCGLAEAYTSTFVADDPRPDAIRLPLPLSAETGLLRTTLLPSLVDAVRRNLAAGNSGIALFEIARVYLPAEPGKLPEEQRHAAAVLDGSFERAKGIVETLYGTLKLEPRFESAGAPLFHPGTTARLDSGLV